MLSANDIIEPGELKLQSFSRPPLPAGNYSLHSELQVASTGDANIPEKFSGTELLFSIKAPRFSLDSSLIHSVYPLPGSTAAYQDSMPHIVFTRKTLPWERAITTRSQDARPWLCLLLLTEDEIAIEPLKKIQVKNLLNAAPDMLPPKLLPEDVANITDEINVLEIKASLFKNVAPRGNDFKNSSSELDYLTHTRQADTTKKPGTNINDDNGRGWYSVIVGNRLPTVNKNNSVFLVSLDGYSDLIDGDGMQPSDNSIVRLVVLHQWQFTAKGPTFDKLVDELNKDAAPLTMQFKTGVTVAPTLAKAINYGYAPLNHTRRNGSQSLSWYRGPLVPVKVDKPPIYTFNNADAALRFDTTNNMFDISYAVAWQLGRLLALQDAGFATTMSNWKNAYKRDTPLEIAKEILVGMKIDMDGLTSLISDIESDEILTDYLIELWSESLS